jgi:2,6-dihydroxypseudooxynicotine hydrolase
MIDGADSTKEEYHSWSDELLKRGMASVTFDGPGQGELAPRYGGPPLPFDRYEAAISRVVDYLRDRPEVDPERIGGWGVSLGGYLISRAAALDSRLRAAVSLSGFYDCRDFVSWPVSIQLNVRECTGLATLQETAKHLSRHCTLKGLSEKIACPYLVVHGERDDLVGVDEAKRMVDEAREWGEWQLVGDAFHVCMNRKFQVTTMIVDWLGKRLRVT